MENQYHSGLARAFLVSGQLPFLPHKHKVHFRFLWPQAYSNPFLLFIYIRIVTTDKNHLTFHSLGLSSALIFSLLFV